MTRCTFGDAPAVAMGPQSYDQGVTVTLVPICADCAANWWDGADWVGSLLPIPTTPDPPVAHQEVLR